MYTFIPEDEGYHIEKADRRAVGKVTTKTFVEKTIKDRDGREVALAPEVKTLPKEQWVFHFAGGKLTLPELQALISEVSGLS